MNWVRDQYEREAFDVYPLYDTHPTPYAHTLVAEELIKIIKN